MGMYACIYTHTNINTFIQLHSRSFTITHYHTPTHTLTHSHSHTLNHTQSLTISNHFNSETMEYVYLIDTKWMIGWLNYSTIHLSSLQQSPPKQSSSQQSPPTQQSPPSQSSSHSSNATTNTTTTTIASTPLDLLLRFRSYHSLPPPPSSSLRPSAPSPIVPPPITPPSPTSPPTVPPSTIPVSPFFYKIVVGLHGLLKPDTVDAELLHVIEIESLEPAAEFTKPLAISRNFDPVNLPTSKGGKKGEKGKKMEHVDRLHAIRLCVRDQRTGRKSIEVRPVCEIYITCVEVRLS